MLTTTHHEQSLSMRVECWPSRQTIYTFSQVVAFQPSFDIIWDGYRRTLPATQGTGSPFASTHVTRSAGHIKTCLPRVVIHALNASAVRRIQKLVFEQFFSSLSTMLSIKPSTVRGISARIRSVGRIRLRTSTCSLLSDAGMKRRA